jgi:hypothetical protein
MRHRQWQPGVGKRKKRGESHARITRENRTILSFFPFFSLWRTKIYEESSSSSATLFYIFLALITLKIARGGRIFFLSISTFCYTPLCDRIIKTLEKKMEPDIISCLDLVSRIRFFRSISGKNTPAKTAVGRGYPFKYTCRCSWHKTQQKNLNHTFVMWLPWVFYRASRIVFHHCGGGKRPKTKKKGRKGVKRRAVQGPGVKHHRHDTLGGAHVQIVIIQSPKCNAARL